MQAGNTDFTYRNELDKACFQHDMAYGKSKYLAEITQSDKVFKDKAFKIAIDRKYDVYQRRLASVVQKVFDKTSTSLNKSSESGVANEPNYQLADELDKQIIQRFHRRKVYSSFREKKSGVDLAGMQSVSEYNKAIKKEGRKPNKIWVDQGDEFYNNSFKKFLKINNIEMYSTYNEGKSAVAERFIRTLKNKIFRHMTAISKNVYFDVLDDIVNKYSNTVHRSIKMKPFDVTSDSYAKYIEDSNEKDPKFKVGHHVRI